MDDLQRRNLFEMVLKATPYPGFVHTKVGQIISPNSKMQSELLSMDREKLESMIKRAMNYPHPAVLPWNDQKSWSFLISLPLINSDKDSDRLGLFVPNQQKLTFQPPLLNERSWHELNNPLTIISLSLQKAFKKNTLNQEDIDTLWKRLNESFERIESFISSQVPK